MRLDDWLAANGVKQSWFRTQLNPPVSPATISSWISGIRAIPLHRAIEIKALTRNRVKPEDWVS